LHTTDAGAQRGRKIKRQFIRLSHSDRNDHVFHDNDDNHNNDIHSNNDQYDLVRVAGPSVPTEENAQNEPPASDLPPEQAEGKGGQALA
jgi:hypothetical protein